MPALAVALFSVLALLTATIPRASAPRVANDSVSLLSAGGFPQPLDISGNVPYWARNTNHATETSCNSNKVASTTQGAGPMLTATLTTGQSACWYADATTGATILAGSWEALLDVSTSGGGGGSVTFDVAGNGWGSGTTIDITGPSVGSGSNRLLVVGISQGNTETTLTSVTWDQGGTNQAMTRVSGVNHPGGGSDVRVELWRLVNPTSGARTLRIVSPSAVGVSVGIAAYTGVDQTTPNDAPASATGGPGGSTSVSVPSVAGDLVVDASGTKESAASKTAGAGQTERYDRFSGGDEQVFGSDEAGAASVTMSWTGAFQEWVAIGMSLNPAPGGPVEYDVYLEVWDKPTNTVKTTIGSCLNVVTTGNDVQCLVSGVAQQVLDADDVVRVRVAHSSAAGSVMVDFDDFDATGDSRITLPRMVARVGVAPSSIVVPPATNQVFDATAYDQWDVPVPGVAFSWIVTNGVGTLNTTSGPSVTLTTQPPAPAVGTVEATGAGKIGVANVTVTIGPAVRVAVTPPSVALPPFTNQVFTATAYDQWDNPVPGAPFTWVVTNGVGTLNTTTGSSVTLTTQPPVGAVGTVEATTGSLMGAANVTVTTGPVFRVAVTPPSVALPPFTNQVFTATAYDQWDNLVPGAAFTWAVTNGVGTLNTSAGPSVTLTTQPPVGALGTVEATASGITGIANVTVTTGPVFRVAVTPPSVALPPFTNQVFTATAYDQWDNPIPGAAFTWVVTNGVGTLNTSAGPSVTVTVQPPIGGVGTVEATTVGITGVANITVTTGPIVRVDVTPPSAALPPFATQAFTATAYDQWDNPVPGAAFTWVVTNGVGTLNTSSGPSVLLTAQLPVGAVGTVEATATGVTGVASVTVTTGPIVRVDVAPPSVALPPASNQGFTATAYDQWDNPVAGAAFTWVVTNGVGTLNASTGASVTLTTQPPAPATGTVEATASGVTGIASVTLITGPIVRVGVVPPNIALPPFTNQVFTATAYDAWDDPVPAAFTWVVTNGVGTLNASAGISVTLTTQPPVNVWGTVEATTGGITGTAAVFVGAPSPPWIAISAPASGAHITGAVSLTFTNSPDAVFVAFEYDAGAGWVPIGNTSSPTGTFAWDTTGVDAVGVVLRGRVENAALMTNETTVSPIEIDNTPPTILLGTITDNQATSGTIAIAYTTAADVVRVDFTYFDGAWWTIGTDFTVDGSYVWTPASAINGVTLRAVATDEVGLTGADQRQGVGTRVVGTNPPTIAAIPTIYVRTSVAFVLNLTFYLSDPDTPLAGLAFSTSDAANVTAFAGSYPYLRINYATVGTYDTTLWASDGTDTAWRIVRVVASTGNPPALLSPLGTVTFDEDTVLVDALGVLIGRFTDADGDTLTFTVLGASAIAWRINGDTTLDLWALQDWFGSEVVRVRASDPSGGFAEAPVTVIVRPVNDGPILAAIAQLQWTAGEPRDLDLTPFITDVDTPAVQLIVTTDSPYVRVNGLVLTMTFPANWTEARFTVTVSDGALQASQPVFVTLLPPGSITPFLFLLPVVGIAMVIGVVARRTRWRPAKAFLMDEKNELIREFTMDPGCQVTWDQVQGSGALDAVEKPVKVSRYRAQTVRGDALGLVLLAYGPVNHDQIEFAREMLVNIQGKFEDRLNARLDQNRAFESQVRTLHDELQSKREAFETRSRAFAGMFDAWTTAQSKMAAESASIRATVADVESREESLIEGGHNLDRERTTLRKEREEFTALADRLKAEMDRRNGELEEREDAIGTMDSKMKEERKSFDTLRQEKMQRLASMDVEIEAKAKRLAELEAAVKSQAEENARLLSDLAAREETLEIEGDRVERLRQEVDQRKAQTEVVSRDIDARASAARDQEARKSEEYGNWQATLESRESVLREQEKAFQSQMTNLHETASAKQQMLDGREGKVGELESMIRAEADRIKKTVDDFGKREQAAQDALREARALKAEVDSAHDALERRSMELDEREASLGSEVERRRAEVVRMEEAMKVSEGDLISRRAEVETAERFLDRQMDEIHEATRNVTSRETDVAATERDREAREAKLAARTTDLGSLERDLSSRRNTIEEESSKLARGQVDFDARRREFEARVASADATLRDLSNREREVIGRENAYKARETALQSRESEFLRREMTFRDRESQFDHVLRGIEQREAVLASRTSKIDEELRTATALREEAKSEKDNTEQAKTAADAQQAEVARTMKFLQKKAVDILDREELLRKREKKLEETERILDSQVEIVETQRTAIQVERSESGARISRLQAEIERMRAIVADADRPSAAAAGWSPEAEKDIENRLKIIQQKAFALLDREERLREREEELNARERLIVHR